MNHSLSSISATTLLFVVLLTTACTEVKQEPAGTEPVSELENPELREQLQGSAGSSEDHPGAPLYKTHCANCHDSGVLRAPARNLLEFLSPEAVLSSLTTGIMKQQAAHLDDNQKNQIVEYLVGTPNPTQDNLFVCEESPDWFDWTQKPSATGWGIDLKNTRLVTQNHGKLSASDVPRLKPKWVFDYPRSNRARSHPSFAGGAVFVGSQTGVVYALDQDTGCIRWQFQASAEVRTGITIQSWDEQRQAIGFFADILARVYAVDLVKGTLLWSEKVDDHHNATTTAQPVLFEGLLFQPVSSLEVVPAADPNYSCCSFRGSVVTMNAKNGTIIRTTYTIPEAPKQVATNNVGVPVLAPSGAPVWNTPTVDEKKRRLYFGTGENYSSPADGNSDAIIAMNIDDGSIAWVRQTTPRDAWNVACMPIIVNQTNCPEENGPDEDYGAPPILVESDSDRILVAGQKSGVIWGIDPEDGSIRWRNRVGRGGVQGGMHFGMAGDGELIYVPISDFDDDELPIEDARPGIYALNAFTGELVWSSPADNVCGDKVDCDPGISAAISAISGAAFAGHMDGRLRVYAKNDGRVIWEFDTARAFTTVAGRTARGGSFGGGTAPVVHNGMLFANSGYGLYFHMPGNVLIAFEPE